MEAILSSETSVNPGSTHRHILEDDILHSHRCENLISYILSIYYHVHNSWPLDPIMSHSKSTQTLTACFLRSTSALPSLLKCFRPSGLEREVFCIFLVTSTWPTRTYIHLTVLDSDIFNNIWWEYKLLPFYLCNVIRLSPQITAALTSETYNVNICHIHGTNRASRHLTAACKKYQSEDTTRKKKYFSWYYWKLYGFNLF
jgi:hypothetical protein